MYVSLIVGLLDWFEKRNQQTHIKNTVWIELLSALVMSRLKYVVVFPVESKTRFITLGVIRLCGDCMSLVATQNGTRSHTLWGHYVLHHFNMSNTLSYILMTLCCCFHDCFLCNWKLTRYSLLWTDQWSESKQLDIFKPADTWKNIVYS